jgi:regulator of RNase E activity RraA
MRTGKDRVQLEALQVPVSIGSATVKPGDLLLGDADGVVAVPEERAAEVIALAQDIETAENRIRKAVEDGMRLDQARQQFKYFDLQRHQTKS